MGLIVWLLRRVLGAIVVLIAYPICGVQAADRLGVFDPSAGRFHFSNRLLDGPASRSVRFGQPATNWIPVLGDWNGDGVDTLGVYDPTSGKFKLRDENKPGDPTRVFEFGPTQGSTFPIAGDWNGDGVDTVGLYDAARGRFILAEMNRRGARGQEFRFGSKNVTQYPVAGDWDGDGLDSVGLYNPETAVFNLRNSNASGHADKVIALGRPGRNTLPVAGDWLGAGLDSIGLFKRNRGSFRLRKHLTTRSGSIKVKLENSDRGLWALAGTWQARMAHDIDIRVNAGGKALLDVAGKVWVEDHWPHNGEAVSAASNASELLPLLYRTNLQTKKGGESLRLFFDVPKGRYRVSLYFAEFDRLKSRVGSRVFDVKIAGRRVWRNLDIFAEVGANTALVKSQIVELKERGLALKLLRVVGEPRIAAIRILREDKIENAPSSDQDGSGDDQSQPDEPTPPKEDTYSDDYTLYFSDEFEPTDSGAPNPNHWDYDVSFVRNNELQCYTDNRRENVRVENRTFGGATGGYLVLELRKEVWRCPQDGNEIYRYTSGSVSSRVRNKRDYLIGSDKRSGLPFGIYEIRAKIPAGRGTWPALWLVGHRNWDVPPGALGWPAAGEIDIMEAVGFEEANGLYRLHSHVHRSRDFSWPNGRGKSGQGMTITLPDPPSSRFRTWKMIWERDSIEIFVDQQRVTHMEVQQPDGRRIIENRRGFFRSDPGMNADSALAWPFSKELGNEFKLIFNLAYGGGWGGQQGVDDSIFEGAPVEMLIDYVRIYTKTPAHP